MISPETQGPDRQTSSTDTEAEAAHWIAQFDREGHLDAELDIEYLCSISSAFEHWINENLAHRVSFLQTFSAWQRTHRLAALRSDTVDVPEYARPRRARTALVSAAIAMAAAICVAAFLPLSGWLAPTPVDEPVVYFSQLGETRTVTLEDGSIITLNTNSRVDVRYSDGFRDVELVRGEALFEVTKNPDRPFRVDTPDGNIIVRGTVFAVEMKVDAIEVAVSEGRVSLTSETASPDASVELTAGMIGYSNRQDAMAETVGMAEVENRLLWRSGRLRFSNMPLSDVVAEFNRYSRLQLTVEDGQAADVRIGGTFATDNVEGFLRLAETGLGLTVKRSGERVQLSDR